MSRLGSPRLQQLFLDVTKSTKELFDNSAELLNVREHYNLICQAESTTEQNEKFVSTVRDGAARNVPEGTQTPMMNTYQGYETIIGMKDKAVTGKWYTYEYWMGRMDSTEKFQEDYLADSLKNIRSIYNLINRDFFSLLNNGFTTTLTPNPTKTLFATDHNFTDDVDVNDPNNQFDNLLPPVSPSTAVLDDLYERVGEFTDIEWIPMLFNINKLFVKKGGSASREWKKILGIKGSDQYQANLISGTNNGINIYMGADDMQLIETPYISSGTAYYFSPDYSMEDLTNPLYIAYMERPTLYADFRDVDTFSDTVKFVSYYKTGVRNIPIGLYGSAGA